MVMCRLVDRFRDKIFLQTCHNGMKFLPKSERAPFSSVTFGKMSQFIITIATAQRSDLNFNFHCKSGEILVFPQTDKLKKQR